MRIAEYKTASGSDVSSLDKAVNDLIRQGFEPYGNPYFGTWNIPEMLDTRGFFQAMIMTAETGATLESAKAEASVPPEKY